MTFRKSEKSDAVQIMSIVNQAKAYLKSLGIDQWQNGYPNEDIINQDISQRAGYVLSDNDSIVATVAMFFGIEPTYNKIDGEWLSGNNENYCTIHRLAVDNAKKNMGNSSLILQNIQEICKQRNMSHIRVDTHNENVAMRQFLQKNGFIYCGTIYIPEEKGGCTSERAAYEKSL